MEKWSKEFPQEEGYFWFYGYRYGKFGFGMKNKPELMFIEVSKTQNGFAYIGEGQFIYEQAVEEPHFLKAKLPDLPKLEE